MEWLGTVLGLVGVALMVKGARVGWLIALGSAACYVVVYARLHFYGQMGLNLFYCVLQAYGWFAWGGDSRAPSRRPHWPWLLGGVPAVAVATFALERLGSRDVLHDVIITVYSVIAQIWLAQRRRAGWLLFLVVDSGVVWFSLRHHLYPTAGLFTGYLGLATWGALSWTEPPAESGDGPLL